MKTKTAIFSIFLISVVFNLNAQYRTIDSYSFFSGYSFFKTDFGARNDMNTNLNNTGVELGGKIYLNLFPYHWQWQGMYHFKTYLVLSAAYGRVDHIGRWTDGKTGPTAEKLRNMYAKPFIFGAGFGTDYSVQNLQYYNFTKLYGIFRFNVTLGFEVAGYYYSPNIQSALGDITDPVKQTAILHPRFIGKVYPEAGITFGATFKTAIHYQINSSYHIYLENRSTWFLSDKVDGLDVNDTPDKYTDWLFTPAIGITYLIW